MKQRKLTLLSRITLSYFKMGWIIVFGALYSVICISQIETTKSYYSFLEHQWIFSYQSTIWANAISHTCYLEISPLKDNLGIDVAVFKEKNKERFANSLVTNEGLLDFNEQIMGKSDDVEYKEFSNVYTTVYFTNLCTFMEADESSNCLTIA